MYFVGQDFSWVNIFTMAFAIGFIFPFFKKEKK